MSYPHVGLRFFCPILVPYVSNFFLQGLGEFVTFFQKLQNVCEEIADAKYESFMMGINF